MNKATSFNTEGLLHRDIILVKDVIVFAGAVLDRPQTLTVNDDYLFIIVFHISTIARESQQSEKFSSETSLGLRL
jgi:hypothetical protein